MNEMTFHCQEQPSRTMHVRNAVIGYLGQPHVYKAETFTDSTRTVDQRQIVWRAGYFSGGPLSNALLKRSRAARRASCSLCSRSFLGGNSVKYSATRMPLRSN